MRQHGFVALAGDDSPQGRRLQVGVESALGKFMTIIAQAFDPMTGAINTGGPFYVCRVLIHDQHQLVGAWVYTTNVVLTGVIEVTLRAVGEQGPRAGSLVCEVLTNDGLVAKSSLVARYDLVLLKFAKENDCVKAYKEPKK